MKIGLPGAATWMYDLIAPDDVARGRALARHQESVARRTGVSYHGPDGDRTIFWHLEEMWCAEPWYTTAVTVEQWPFVALYLRWEGRFPNQWRTPGSETWSPWTRKEAVLRHLGRYGLPAEVRRDAVDLVADVVHRPYRCKDWMYALLVRHVDSAHFRDRMTALEGADDPLVRLRARFLLDVADHPGLPVKRATWGRWLRSRPE
ncbi:hypothetical protein [Lentzea sp. NPDC055074]